MMYITMAFGETIVSAIMYARQARVEIQVSSREKGGRGMILFGAMASSVSLVISSACSGGVLTNAIVFLHMR